MHRKITTISNSDSQNKSYRKLGLEVLPGGVGLEKVLQINTVARCRGLAVDLQTDRVSAVHDETAAGDAAGHQVLVGGSGGGLDRVLRDANAVREEVLDQKRGELGLLEQYALGVFLLLSVIEKKR